MIVSNDVTQGNTQRQQQKKHLQRADRKGRRLECLITINLLALGSRLHCWKLVRNAEVIATAPPTHTRRIVVRPPDGHN